MESEYQDEPISDNELVFSEKVLIPHFLKLILTKKLSKSEYAGLLGMYITGEALNSEEEFDSNDVMKYVVLGWHVHRTLFGKIKED